MDCEEKDSLTIHQRGLGLALALGRGPDAGSPTTPVGATVHQKENEWIWDQLPTS